MIEFKPQNKIVVYEGGHAVGSIKESKGFYKFKPHKGLNITEVSSDNLEDLKDAVRKILED